MSDFNSKLIKYKSLNILTHLNETFPSLERSVLLMERDKVNMIKSNMETEIFKVFLQNSDSLLDILYSYEEVYSKLNELKDITYKRSTINKKLIDDRLVNKKKLLDFKGVINNFTSDLSSFDSNNRVLESFVFLDPFIFLFTDDILIIGKKIDKKYTLINTFKYSLITMKRDGDKLVIKMGNNIMIYKNKEEDKDKVGEILNIFKNLSSVQINNEPEQTKLSSDDINEYYDFINEKYSIYDEDSLKKGDPFTFLTNKFKESLSLVSKIKPLPDLIEDSFDFLYRFHEEEKDLLDKSLKMILMVEDHIKEVFKYFEKRLIRRRFYTTTFNEIMKMIREKLVFMGYDFVYMEEYLMTKVSEEENKYIEKGKEEIRKLVRECII